MPLPPRLFAGDEELGKKDDDHRPGMKSPYGSWTASQHRRAPNRRSIKRVLIVATTLIGLYYFFKNMPTDLTQPRPRPTYTHTDSKMPSAGSHGSGSSTHKGGRNGELEEQPQHYFDGPIKFYQLATTLHALSMTKGGEQINNNVLFAAASLKSVSTLLPIACEMAEKKRSFVHFAVMGRDTLSMDIIKAVNGLEDGCNILYHDARPDYSVESTEFRMAVSTSAALGHINTFMHPQAILVDGSEEEEAFFMRGIRERAGSIGRTVIELPKNTEQSLLWITELDAASLSSWNRFSVDILVHAPPAASGSLIRLLESLRKADYFSSLPPRLTIDLPQKIDEPTRRYLENFKWPPSNVASHGAGSQLSLHHRIPQYRLTPEENNIRFLEAFWPADPSSSHIMVLSSEVELSPVYFHYLKFTTLEYRYSTAQRDAARNLLGISLDLPSTYLNDSAGFEAPADEDLEGSSDTADYSSPFLWQAPNSNAALYFGEKWAELHDLVSHTLKAQHKLPTPTTLNEKLVSKTFPSWLEHVLQLARARGYWMLYHTFSSTNSLATIHNELYRIPEEFSNDTEGEKEHLDPSADTDAELTADPAHHLSLKHTETPLFSTTLLGAMSGTLPEVKDMPLLSWDGEQISRLELEKRAVEYSRIFRREIGGCEILSPEKQRLDLMASDLFCLNEGDNVPLPAPTKEEDEPPAPAIEPEPAGPSRKTSSTLVGILNIPTDPPVLVKGAR